MGNSANNTERNNALKNLEMHKYMNQGLSQGQVLQIWEAFNSYNPVDG